MTIGAYDDIDVEIFKSMRQRCLDFWALITCPLRITIISILPSVPADHFAKYRVTAEFHGYASDIYCWIYKKKKEKKKEKHAYSMLR